MAAAASPHLTGAEAALAARGLDIPGEYGQPAPDMLEFCEVDRESFPSRSLSIANSDSAAFAYTHSAINEGYLAGHDPPA